MKILIAEDDFCSRKLIQACLNRYGECHLAVNGLEAYEAFVMALREGKPYDLICLDIMMPDVDGHEALRQIRDKEEQLGINRKDRVKIIMITALDDMKAIMSSYYELCDEYLMKPIDQKTLLEQIRKTGLNI